MFTMSYFMCSVIFQEISFEDFMYTCSVGY